MINSIKHYRNSIDEPWGMLFYDILFKQLDVGNKKLNILDFGSGFGKTANHLAKNHNVTALEPNKEMIDLSIKENEYTQIHGDYTRLLTLNKNSFDLILCHNVLEYSTNQKQLISYLMGLLKPEGVLSVVKHNHLGKVMQHSVLSSNPKLALDSLSKNMIERSTFGELNCYCIDDIKSWIVDHNAYIDKVLGIRTFFGLSQDNSVKYNKSWYYEMLKLETEVSTIEEFIKIAFYNHIVIKFNSKK